MEEVVITNHARERMKERMRIKSPERMQREATKAYLMGKTQNELHGIEWRLLQMVEKDEFPERDYRLYQDRIFVFIKDSLITVLPTDNRFRKIMEKNRYKQKKMITV